MGRPPFSPWPPPPGLRARNLRRYGASRSVVAPRMPWQGPLSGMCWSASALMVPFRERGDADVSSSNSGGAV
eukprot:3554338-Lingulodinium_polyedra.AAC.1